MTAQNPTPYEKARLIVCNLQTKDPILWIPLDINEEDAACLIYDHYWIGSVIDDGWPKEQKLGQKLRCFEYLYKTANEKEIQSGPFSFVLMELWEIKRQLKALEYPADPEDVSDPVVRMLAASKRIEAQIYKWNRKEGEAVPGTGEEHY